MCVHDVLWRIYVHFQGFEGAYLAPIQNGIMIQSYVFQFRSGSCSPTTRHHHNTGSSRRFPTCGHEGPDMAVGRSRHLA